MKARTKKILIGLALFFLIFRPKKVNGKSIIQQIAKNPNLPSYPVDIIASHWDGFGVDLNEANPKKYSEALNAPASNRFVLSKHLGKIFPPFFAQYHSQYKIRVPRFGKVSTIFANENVKLRFNLNQETFDQQLDYANYAGFAAFNFYFYDFDSPNSESRQLYDSSNRKGNIKYLFTLSDNIGYNEAKTIDYVTNKMMEQNYYKTNGRPVIYLEGEKAHNLINKIKMSFGQKSNIKPFFVKSGAYFYPDYTNDFDAVGAYSIPTFTNVSLEAENLKKVRKMNNNIIPTITLGFENLWPYETRPNKPAVEQSEIISHLFEVKKLIKPNFIPFVNVYSWTEFAECGKSSVCPKIMPEGSIDKSILDLFKTIINR